MKPKRTELSKAFAEGRYVRLNRKPMDEFSLDGFIVDLSDKLLMLHVVGGQDLRLNGYVVVRIKDIKRFEVGTSFIERYLRLNGVCGVAPPQIDLTDLSSFLSSAARWYLLLTIECELTDPGCCFIGRLEKLTSQILHLRTVDLQASWATVDCFKLKDITQVAFSDGYTEALEWLIAHEDEAKQTG